MEYDFYQKVAASGMTVKVGRAFVPDGRSVWNMPKHQTLNIADATADTPPVTTIEEITYHRTKAISGDIFIATV